ncbi:histidine kinase [Arcobacter sp. CECT 8986]|uniref:sensor histidine kinase n=1 Tax=Arcobacter sp. CECT 8986 TaxID=2044507 RepID=UPI001009F6E5|nr:HAMP domain-containing sensor histidine kinase [Arcobacter sp. CECT 8986]RXJ98619.1 histidine kinase [Arcobacter sp. CECT 8986]
MRQTNLDEFLQLEEENKKLESKIKEEVRKNQEKEKVLVEQSKMASMGEMLSSIAHQWRQPLMEINSLFIPIEAKAKIENTVNKKELLTAIEKLNEITNYMSNTINDFRNFFSANKQKHKFNLSTQLNSVMNILSTSLKENNINIEIVVKKNPEIYGLKSEYSQVLINIINNAREILILRKVKNPLIKITIDKKEDTAVVLIEDNAGGIKIANIQDIFKPFVTFEKSNGTGVGLFMSKVIIEKNMNGYLDVTNSNNGALFKIITPLNLTENN